MPALHAALKALALAHAGHIHQLADLEVLYQHAIPRLGFVLGIVNANLFQITQRRDIRFLEMSSSRLVYPLRLDEFHQAQVNGLISVSGLRATLLLHARSR